MSHSASSAPGANVLRTRLLFALAILSALSANFWILLRNPLNNDVAWYLYLGGEILAGKRLYIDYIETNPPLICFPTVVPVWLAGVFHASVKLVWISSTTLLCAVFAAAAAWFWGMAQKAQPASKALTLVFLLVVSLAFFFAFDFGQRDHLAFVASLPLCGLMAARLAASPVRNGPAIATAVAAGLLLALKPYFLLPWLLCLIWAIRLSGWRVAARWPETYIVPAMSLVQPILVVFLAPGYFVVARLVASLYSSFSVETWGTLLTRPFLLIALAGGLVALSYPASPASRTSIRLASLNALGWFLSGLLQRKGWHYHTLPAVAAASVAIWLIMLDLASTGSVRRGLWQNAMRFATVLLLVFAGVRTLRVSWGYPSGNGNLVPLVAREARGRSVIGLATGMSIFPLVNDTETHLGLHYNSLWLLPGLYAQQVSGGSPDGQWHYRRPAEMGDPEREMFDSVAGDLAAEPALVILWRRATQQGMGELRVDLVGYFAQDPRVRAALNRYEPISVPGDYLVLRHLPSGSTASSLVR